MKIKNRLIFDRRVWRAGAMILVLSLVSAVVSLGQATAVITVGPLDRTHGTRE